MTITLNGTNGITTPEVVLDNTAADGGQVVLKSSGYSDWNWDNYSGRLRAYYGGTEYFTINSSGNVGIGTSSPSYKLQVESATTDVQVASKAASGAGLFRSQNSNAITWFGVDAASPIIGSVGNATVLWGNNNYPMIFATNNTERMRIDSSGNLLVGTTSTLGDGKVHFKATSASAVMRGQVYADGWYVLGCMNAAGSTVGGVIANTSSTSYATSSDYRLKENIQPMQNALAVVQQLNPVTYTWKADGSDGQGFIAHELQEIVPDCVTGEKDAVDAEGNPVYQGIDTSFLVATLTKAIQEQQEQIEQMKQEIAALKGAA